MHAADQLHDDVAAVVEDVDAPRCVSSDGSMPGRGLAGVAHQNAPHGDVDAVAPADALALAREQIDEAAADGAASEEADVYPAHAALLGDARLAASA